MRKKLFNSLSARVIGPLLFLLSIFIFLVGVFAWNFREDYSKLSEKITLNSQLSQHIFEITRLRARMQELLLRYRIKSHPSMLTELSLATEMRMVHLEALRKFADSNHKYIFDSYSIIGGINETAFLRGEMIKAVQAKDYERADEAFRQLSTIFEINAARLKDLSMQLLNEMQVDEKSLSELLRVAMWMLFLGITLIALSTWIIAVFYKRRVLNPLKTLQGGLQSVSSGNLETRVSSSIAPNEILEMIADFNSMATALETKQKEVYTALNLRTEFLSIASHELKTPLTVLKLQAQLTARAIQTGDTKAFSKDNLLKFAQLLDSQTVRLNKLVEEMLEVTRIESGKLQLNLESVNLNELIAEIKNSIFMNSQPGAEIKFNFGPDFNGTWDRHRLEQVVINLLTNAIKYGEGKPVDIETRVEGSTAKFIVKDYGKGIDKKFHSRIFQRFERAESRHGISGLGLGLYISEKIVAAHGGRITVESELGKGSIFTVELPIS